MSNLKVMDREVATRDSLYSLNDLHKAAGNLNRHRPSLFVANRQTKSLILEIESSLSRDSCLAIKTVKGGDNPGTYVCRELVYAYAMWISPKFHLEIIRAFDQRQQPDLPPHFKVMHDLVMQAAETERRLAKVESSHTKIKQRLDNFNGDIGYRTVLAFCRERDILCGRVQAQSIGVSARRLCRERGISIGSVPDERYGSVNSYPAKILEEVTRVRLV